MTGDLTRELTGDLTGELTGELTGDLIGDDLARDLAQDLSGDLTGDILSSRLIGDILSVLDDFFTVTRGKALIGVELTIGDDLLWGEDIRVSSLTVDADW